MPYLPQMLLRWRSARAAPVAGSRPRADQLDGVRPPAITPPAHSGRGLVVSVLFAVCVLAWLVWTVRATAPGRPSRPSCTCWRPPAACSAAPRPTAPPARSCSSRSSPPACACELPRAFAGRRRRRRSRSPSPSLIYDGSAIGLLAYSLGFAAATARRLQRRQSARPGPNRPSCCSRRPSARMRSSCAPRGSRSRRGSRARSTMCSRTRSRASTIQLEATSALLEQGADRDDGARRVRPSARARARGAARDAPRRRRAARRADRRRQAGIEALVAEYRATRRGRPS